MATEIERKFLVTGNGWREHIQSKQHYIQGYFTTHEACSIRIRVTGKKARLNIKSATLGITRSEYDYPIPAKDAEEMLHSLCKKPLLEKTRYFVRHENHLWEIDVFHGDNEGLVIAEIELQSGEEEFARPEWVGKEVSDDPRYYNTCLVDNPWKNWKNR